MTYVIEESRTGTNDSGGAGDPPAGSIHPTPGAPAFAAAERPHTDPDERTARAPKLGDGAAMNNARSDPRAPESADDSGRGLALFVIFISAVLIVTGAVALLALVDSWWMLGVVFAVDITTTAVVVWAVFHALTGRATRGRHATAQYGGVDALPSAQAGQSTARDHLDPQPVPAVAPSGGAVSHSSAPAPPTKSAAPRPRVLMITDERLAQANEVPEPIRPLVDQAEVYVVAPTLTTRLQSLTGDIDRARASARERLRTVFDHMHADGLEPRGMVGDEDQVAAIADALAGFEADLMVLRLHAEGSENENWRERRLAKRVRARFDVPTIAFFFDAGGQVVGREEGEAGAPA